MTLPDTEATLSTMVTFYVEHELYKGHLLAPHQIAASSRIPERVARVEAHFSSWLRKMQKVITQGQQLVKDPPDVGPQNELEYWQQMLARYTSIVEFVSSKPFFSYLECMIQSKSKLVKRWRHVDQQLSAALNVARDNVRYVGSLQQYWDPLYRCTPDRLYNYVRSLMVSLRSVYLTSRYYNTSFNVTSFLVKCTNQMTIACKSYLTDADTVPIFDQPAERFMDKINVCERLMTHYQAIYYETLETLEPEVRWTCSPNYLFGVMNLFRQRVQQIKQVMMIQVTYKVLKRIRICNMDVYEKQLDDAHARMVKRPYSMLDHRVKVFYRDYTQWNEEIEKGEYGMQQFVKQTVEPILTTEGKLLVLKRFERLQLECLCLDRRYLDVFKMYEKELIDLKDTFNEQRHNPEIPRNMPPAAGRITWLRGMQQRIDAPMDILKLRPCVIEHRSAQLSVKYFNFLSELFMHAEMQLHKGWFDYVEEVRVCLESTVLTKNSQTNWLEVNFEKSIRQLVREGECMLKLRYTIPFLGEILVFCRDKVMNSYEKMRQLVQDNNELRNHLDMCLLSISRPLLRELDLAFKPGLSTVSWTSDHLEEYFASARRTVDEVGEFMKQVMDIKVERIDRVMESIMETNLIFIPEQTTTWEELLRLNDEHRKSVGE